MTADQDQDGVESVLVVSVSTRAERREAQMSGTATEVAERYFTAWQARYEEALMQILSDDVTFRGPLGTANGRTECIAGLMGMLGVVTSIEVQARVADDHNVITWFELHTSVAPPAPTANWSHPSCVRPREKVITIRRR